MSTSPQGLLDAVFNVPAVLFYQGIFYGLFGQIQNLKQVVVKSDEIFADQAVSGLNVLIKTDLEKTANRVVGVEGQAIAIRGQHKEEIQKDFYWIQGCQESIG
jgi:hypothetical protein